jgi:hypothetical protein
LAAGSKVKEEVIKQQLARKLLILNQHITREGRSKSTQHDHCRTKIGKKKNK